MPLVMRRSPESEKAAIYGYGDLLRDIISKISTGATREVARMTSGKMKNEELMEMALAGVGAGAKISKGAPKAARGLMKLFQREGLKYDAFTEPLPGYGYHQWTLYGEGPAKGATFATKTTRLEEMETKVADLIRSFSK